MMHRLLQKFRRIPANPKQRRVVDTKGRRLLGFTLGDDPILAPKGHSLLLSAAGGGKTTAGLMPWLFSLLASASRPAILLLDSKDGEIAHQVCPMLEMLGIPTAVIDETHILPTEIYGRTTLNPIDSVVSTFRERPDDLVFANQSVTHTAIEEPERDERNRYWRAWPRNLIEFAIYILLKRNPRLATPGSIWMLLSSPEKMRRFAEIEAAEGTGMLKALAENIVGMVGHEHWWQHLQAAQDAWRIFAAGTRMHSAGLGAATSHADLIRERRVIILCGSQANIDSLGIFYGLHLMSFIRAAYQRAGPLWIGADEFTNAPVKKLVAALTTVRGFDVEVSSIVQSRSEIERKLGKLECETIEENAIVKQWFGFSSFAEAERISKAIGEEQVINPGLGADNKDLRLQFNYQTGKERFLTPSRLMAMSADEFLGHIKGLGFFLGKKISQQNIAPFCDWIAPNPIEGGKLPPDPTITLKLPETLKIRGDAV